MLRNWEILVNHARKLNQMQPKLCSRVKFTPTKNLHWRTQKSSSSPAEGEFSSEFKMINNKLAILILHFSKGKGRNQKKKGKKKKINKDHLIWKKLTLPAGSSKPQNSKRNGKRKKKERGERLFMRVMNHLQTSQPARPPHRPSAPPRHQLCSVPGRTRWNPWIAVTSRGKLYICRIPPVPDEKRFSSTQKESPEDFFLRSIQKSSMRSSPVHPDTCNCECLSKYEPDTKSLLLRKQSNVMNWVRIRSQSEKKIKLK